MEKYIVLTASAKMPGSCWGRYGKVAVIETDGEHMPKQINERHKSVVRIVKTWDKMHIGKTERGAYQQAVREAYALADQLNSSEVALA